MCIRDSLGAAMQQTDMRIDAGDDFAVQVQNQAKHAMGRRMLGPEIDRHLRIVGLMTLFVVERNGTHGFFPGSPEATPGAMAAFSSPGRMCGAPSQGLMKSKSRNSCTSCTG